MAYQNLESSKKFNLDSWGLDSDHNILYITGLSGSGKSTTANSFSTDTNVIFHLDDYADVEDVDALFQALIQYAEDQWKEGVRIIVEGFQIVDLWLVPNYEYYVDKPMIILTTDAHTCFERSIRTYGLLSHGKEKLEQYAQWYDNQNELLEILINTMEAK